MTWSTYVHTTLSSDTEPSIIVTFDNAKYIFNTSENTGRSFLQSSRSWRRTRVLFFTQARVEKMSGLAGLVMSFADATIKKLSLFGPPGLTHMLATMRMYTFRDGIEIAPSEIPWTTPVDPNPEPCYVDGNITVYAIPVLPFSEPLNIPAESVPISASTTTKDCPIKATELPEKRKREPSPGTSRKRLNPGSTAPGRKPISEGLLTEMRKKPFMPQTLNGQLADEYRQMVIRTMFPNLNPNTEVDAEAKAENRRRSRQGTKAEGKKTLNTSPSPGVPNTTNVDIDSQKRTRSSLPNGFQKQLPTFSTNFPKAASPPALSYVVIGPRYRGKFNADKAKELGIQGSDRGLLTKGQSITIQVQEGDELVQRIIKPEDIIGESETPGAFMILDVPTIAHIPSLVASFKNSQFYRKFWSENPDLLSSSPDYHLRTIYHLCGPGVLEDETYKAFMNGFESDVHHIIASREHCSDPVTFTNAAYNQLRLNSLDEKMFPIPKYSLVPKKDMALIPGLPAKVQPMVSGLYSPLRPFAPPGPDKELEGIDKFHPVATGSIPLEFSPSLQRCLRAAEANVAKRLTRTDIAPMPTLGADIGVIPLGTGGSVPSKYRNVLSTLIRIPNWGNILLDTGEGTWGQLVRNFGLDESPYNAWQALRDLKCIFISHIHGDHHMGLAQILAKRRLLDPPPRHPLYLVSIRNVHLYLRELTDVHDLGLNDPSGNGVISVLSESLHYRATGEYPTAGMWQVGGDEPWLDFRTSLENARNMCESLGLQWLKTVDVYHRCRCFGVSFKHKDGWSVTFSGDTMPTESLVRLGMNSTVLIHEATMADNEAEMAERKGHSTIGQAVNIGKRMNAKNIVLTHISARYPKMPPSVLNEAVDAGPDAKNLLVPAFDHANMTIGDMWKMSFYLPALHCNFRDTMQEEESESRESSPTPAVS